MLFRETRETEEDIRRILCQAREKMKKRITLNKKSDPGKFALPCTVKGIEFPHALCDTGASISILPRVMADHLGLKVESSKESFTFVDWSQRSSGGIVRDPEVQIGNALVPVDFQLFSITWESLLVNSSSSVQHANQPVVPDTHRSSCPLQPYFSQEATYVLQKNRWSRTNRNMPLWSRIWDRLFSVDQNSHCDIDWQCSSEIDRRSAGRIGRQWSRRLGKRLLQSHHGSKQCNAWDPRWFVWWRIQKERNSRIQIPPSQTRNSGTSRNRFTSCRSLWEKNSLQSNKWSRQTRGDRQRNTRVDRQSQQQIDRRQTSIVDRHPSGTTTHCKQKP